MSGKIPLSKIVQGTSLSKIPLNKILPRQDEPEAVPETKSSDEFGWTPRRDRPDADTEMHNSPLPEFLLGSVLETAGNAFEALGDPDRTLAARYSPWMQNFKPAGETLNAAARTTLDDATRNLTVDDYDTIPGAVKNSFGSGGYGSLGGLMSMLHSDKAAKALMDASAALENRNRVSTDAGLPEYFTNPRGFLSDAAMLGGSMATLLPTMFLLPEAAVARGIYGLGGSALERFLINRGAVGAAKFLAQTVPQVVRYDLTSAPTEAAMEGGQARWDALRAGLPESEANRRANEVFSYNLPVLGGSNLVEALNFLAPLRRAGKIGKGLQIGGRGLFGSLQQQFEEANQTGIQDFVAGKEGSEFRLFPFYTTPNREAARDPVKYVGAILGLLGGGGQAVREDELSDAEYTDRAETKLDEKFRPARIQHDYADLKAVQSWAAKGGISNEAFGMMVRASQEFGVPLDRIVATAVAESNGNQDEISSVGAIGIMQLMPETARELGVDPYDMEQNIRGGAKYLKKMYDATGDWTLAHAAYNAGLKNVTDHVPQNGETPGYVARINDVLSERPDVGNLSQYLPEDPNIHYLGSNGAGEGKTWARQHDGVNLDRAQPGLLDAIDALAKWFYEKTGKKLIVTSGNDGDHPSNGSEHGHSAGWKVDINDWDGNSDGYIVNADGTKGTLADELIAYGQSLGLGMNWEGDHIDVALDGTQWDGNGSTANFGGFNPRQRIEIPGNRGATRTSESSETQPQVEPVQTPAESKPLFDLDDERTTGLYERFANERHSQPTDEDDENFFAPMFDEQDNFINTQENRDAIRDFYGSEFTDWAQNILAREQQPDVQPVQPTPKSKSTPAPQPITQPQVSTSPTQSQPSPQVSTPTQPSPQVATSTQQNQPQTQSTQDPVSKNTTPENVLTPPQQNQTTPQVQSETQTTPQVQSTKISGTDGNSAEVLADNRTRYGVRYKVVEADDLNVSHELNPTTSIVDQNKNYPAELQMRDRERAGYRDAVLNMGANLDPTQLMDSGNVNQGAPVIRSDGVVLNGNGRTMAIRRAQATGKADGYRNAILENAERLGLNKDEIAAMKNPVLVREVTGELTDDDLTNITRSQLGGMQLGAIEQAREDAKKLTSQILSRAPEDGDLSKAGARQFLVDAVRAISTPEELNAMTSANEGVTDAGVRRVRNALFTAAFGDNSTLAKLAETSETEGNAVKSVTNALTATAGKFARARAIAQRDNLPQADLTPIIQAVEKLAALREQRTPVFKHLTQETLAGFDTESEDVKDLLGFFEGHKRNPKDITTFMQSIADAALTNVNESGGMFGGKPAAFSLAKAIANARQKIEGEDITQDQLQQAPLFDKIADRMHKRLQTHKDKRLKNFVTRTLENAKNGDETSLRTLNRLKGDPTENLDEDSPSTKPAKGSASKENSSQDAESKQAPPQVKRYRKGSKGDKLHRKLKTDEHPHLRAVADSLLSKAAKGDKTAQAQIDDMLKRDYSDEQLDAWENSLTPQRQATEAEVQVETDPAPESQTASVEESPEAQSETASVEENPNETDGTEEDAKLSRVGSEGTLENELSDDELTPVQKAIQAFCAKLGVPVKFFRSHSDTQGAFKDGTAYINVNSKATPEWVFHHELGHWLAVNNKQLFNQLVKILDITDEQRQAYRDKFKRHELSDAEVDAEILCDMMADEAQRLQLFKDANKKNPSLVERLISWMKNVLDKFVDFMFKPENGLTRSQRNRLYDSIGKLATAIVDARGNKKYRYNRETHALEYADGTPIETLPETKANDPKGTKYSRSETKKAPEGERVEISSGYYTESGRTLKKSGLDEFIVDEDGNRDLAQIPEAVAKKSDGAIKSLPVRLKVGMHSFITQNGRGLRHIQAKHSAKIKRFGFDNAMDFINYTLKNFDQVYKHPKADNKVILFCNDDSRGFMPLELVNAGDHYEIVTAYPNDNKKINGELVFNGSKTPSAATANDTTERKDKTPSEKPDNTGGVKSSGANVVTNSPSESISRDGEQDNPKTWRDTAAGKFFLKAVDKLARALHLKDDDIIRSEDQRQELIAKRKAQEAAIDAYDKNPSEENRKKLKALKVSKEMIRAFRDGKRYGDDLNLFQSWVPSPSELADKVQAFRVFFRMGDRALRKQIQLRGKFSGRYGRIMDIVAKKEDRDNLFGLLWKGDRERQEFGKLTDKERDAAKANRRDGESETQAIQRAKVEKICAEQEVSENVARAYLETRRLLNALGSAINKARRHPQKISRHLSDEEIEKLKGNKFVEIKNIGDKRDSSGKRLVRYIEFENRERTLLVTPKQLEKLKADDAIQILDQSGFNGGQAIVRIREGIPEMTKEKGYIPHFFHEYSVEIRDKTGKKVGKTLFTAQTERDAIARAEEWKQSNSLKDGEKIYISPRGLAHKLGLDAEKLAPIIGDNDFAKMTERIAQLHDMTLEEAQALTKDAVQFKGRRRFLGNLQDRKGAAGFEENMDWVLRHYINISTRYAAMESEFLPQAITRFEKLFGAFDNDYSRNLLAQHTKEYIQDVNGNPTRVEEFLNKTFNKSKFYRDWVAATYGNRGWLTAADATTRFVSYAKLGFYTLSSAVLNLTQLINAGGLLGGYGRLGKHFGKLCAQRGNLTQQQLRILTESGVINDLGLETTSETGMPRISHRDIFTKRIAKIVTGDASKLAKTDALLNESMVIFQTMDTLCRVATTLAAYEQARAQGKSKADALQYAADLNRKANFDYGVTDAPNIFRRSGPIGKIVLQFQKYPVKQLELLAKMVPWSDATTKAQKISFWFPYIFACGLMGVMPFFDWGDKIANKFNFFPKDFLEEVIIKGSQEFFDGDTAKEVSRALLYGIGATANIDLSSRAGLAGFLNNDIPQLLLGAAGSSIYGATENLAKGQYANALRSLSPGLYNYYAAYEGETTGARGRKNMIYGDFWARLRRAFGFRSADESAISDAERIQRHSESESQREKRNAIDAYIDDPTEENAARCAELGIKPKQIITEMRKKELDRWQRFEQNRSKKIRASADFQSLKDFADDDSDED